MDRFPGVMNHVALTIDDVPCRLGPRNSMSFGAKNAVWAQNRITGGDASGVMANVHHIYKHIHRYVYMNMYTCVYIYIYIDTYANI